MAIADRIRAYWDVDAATYDRVPGHRPSSPAEMAAWASALARLLPPPPARVLDCGAGTGFLSLIAARLGHAVTALDVSTAMLSRLEAHAAAESLAIEVVVGSAADPPEGPFDAVIERHVVWTLPDPAAALAAWRKVAPYGRLVLVEGIWGTVDPVEAARARLREVVRRARRVAVDHHAPYEADVRDALPFANGTHPSALVEVVEKAGWPDPWLERLRDVEWAAGVSLPMPERLLGVAPRFVVTAG